MGVIAAAPAAELLGVSVETLSSWETVFGFPRPFVGPDGSTVYRRSEIHALDATLDQVLSLGVAMKLVTSR